MESAVLSWIGEFGIWAGLFIWLLLNTMKENKTREEKLYKTIQENQSVINKLADSLNVVKEIKEDLEEIKSGLGK